MVKSHLPAHMDSVRQKLRPKHQLLILKCYPRLPKNSSADVKPNSSELSYLLYYASTRRSKLQKVGTFLERKTANDVSKSQSARIIVTLQILTALLENKVVGSGNGFTLIAPYVLRTLRDILQTTNDISLVEASLDTWEVFCRDQDQASLAADHEYRDLYEQVVRQWANFANKSAVKKIGRNTSAVSVPDAIRLREAGLGGIKAVLLSDALSSEIGRQLNITIPAILSNLRGEDALYLSRLQAFNSRDGDDEKDNNLRSQSLNTVRTQHTATGSVNSDVRAAEANVQDADALAEEGVAASALACLKTAFQTDNRPQVRSATSEILKYLARYQAENRPETSKSQSAPPVKDWTSWAAKLFEIITAWTAVQDRYILLVTASETLTHLPLRDADLAQHLLLTHLIDDILRSDLNLIGLSIMDILLGLIQQILRVLQLSGPPASGRGSSWGQSSTSDLKADERQAVHSSPTPSRVALLTRLKSCIADLATHVYYTDQIGDMVAAILLRLKPNTSPTAEQDPAATAAAIEEPLSALSQVATNISAPARERSHSQSGGFFTFDTARQIALEAVRDVITVANSSRSRASGGVAESRNTVPLSTWEGTQWLLRDPAPSVRRAYVEALDTWLALETRKADSRIQEPKGLNKAAKTDTTNGTLARRALSNASRKEKHSKKTRNTFLQLLHLAIYENALQHAASSESDILLLHLLGVTIVQRLGVNAVQNSLPMIFALQEDIAKVDSPVAKVRLGSLVHGYFWQLGEQFDFEHDLVGREVYNEISRRKQHGLWMDSVNVPGAPLERIPMSSQNASTVHEMTQEAIAKEALKPFDHRQALVDRIAEAYSSTAVVSPPQSPPLSPSRSFSMPVLDRSSSSYISSRSATNAALPGKVKDAMLTIWTKDGCLAAIAAAAPKSLSLSGSRPSGANNNNFSNHRQLLGAANFGPPVRNNSLPQINSPPTPPSNNSPPKLNLGTNHRQQAFGLVSRRLHSQSPNRRVSGSTNGKRSSSANRTLRVDELKRVLAGDKSGDRPTSLGVGSRFDNGEDTASESLVEVGEGDLGSEDGESDKKYDTAATVGKGKTDLAALLEGIGMEDDGIVGGGETKFGSGRPPY